ncbi:MAG: methyltransferase domain-containing protein [Candidatus Aenigmatarchaeota archaeon]
MQPREFYEETAKNYDKRHNNPTTKHMRKIDEYIIKKYSKGLVLDIGCGTGEYVKLLNNGIGIDISYNMLRESKNKTKNPLIKASAENLPFKDNLFDTILCMFTVLNLCDFEKSVNEMNRVLKKDGVTIVSVASIWDQMDKSLIKRFYSKEKSIKKKVRIDGYRINFYLFSREDFINLFKKNGFELVKFSGLFILQRPYWGWYRNFTKFEKFKLFIEKIFPKKAARLYYGIFKKP